MKALLTLIVWASFFTFSLHAQIDFSSSISSSIGSTHISSVAIGDVNNDGMNDAVVATTFYFDSDHDFSIFVFLQKPDGSLAQPTRYPYNSYSGNTIVQVVDVNNDGLSDVIYIFGDSLGVRYQDAAGALGPAHNFFSGHDADGMKTGDLNNDGLKDIAICHWKDSFIKIFYQQAAGDFKVVIYPLPSAGLDELDVNDMNGDGLDDIIFMPGQLSSSSIYIYYQDRINGIPVTPVEYSYKKNNYNRFNGIATGDLNNDGRNDLVCTMGGNEAWIALIYQKEDGTLQDPIYLNSYDIPTPVEIADLNCDGKNEIIVGHNGWSSFSVWEQDENGKYSGYKLFGSLFYVGPYSLAIGDMNGDSRLDVLTTDGSSNVKFVYNISAPAGTLPTSEIVQFDGKYIDSTNSYHSSQELYGTSRIGECLFRIKYKLTDYTYNTHKEGLGDTLLTRNYFMCGLNHTDTLRRHFDINTYETLYHTDSTMLSADTIVEDRKVANISSSYDTLSITPQYLIGTVVYYTNYFTIDTAYIYLDSLHVESNVLEISYLETRRIAYEGLKCGFISRDTITQMLQGVKPLIINSDTILISRNLVDKLVLEHSDTTSIFNILLYPNPTKDVCNLDITGLSLEEAAYTIQLISLNGRTVWKDELKAKAEIHRVIDGHKLPIGVYTILIRGKNFTKTARVVFVN